MKPHQALLWALAFAAFLFAVGCETPYQRERVLRSFQIEYGVTDGEINRGKRDWGADSSYVAFSVNPFAGIGGPDRVIVEATHAAYAEPAPPPKPIPVGSCGSGHR